MTDLSICADVFSQDQVTEVPNPTTISLTTDPPATESATTVTPTTKPATTVTQTTQPATTITPTTLPPEETCGGPGWRRVAFIDMTDPNQDCPQGLNLTDYSIRSCGRAHPGNTDCSSVTFPVDGLQYSQVCGRATAYRWGRNYAFFSYNSAGQTTIDGSYVDGLSFTHGSPRTHIWTFASGYFNGTSGDMFPDFRCPCDPGNTHSSSPPFVGNDYFCDSVATRENWSLNLMHLFPDNALWDGQDHLNPCYGLNNPPRFNKTLPVPTTDDIELRMCFFEPENHSNIGIQQLEVYVH